MENHGWMITGFQSALTLWIGCGAVLLHVLYRLWFRPGADPIRHSGPGA